MCSSMFVPWPEGMWEHFDLCWPSWPAVFSQMPFLTVVDVFWWGVVASSALYCSQSSFQSQMKWLRSAARGHLTWYSKMLRWPRHSFRCISVHDGKHKGRHRQAEGTFEGADFWRPAESCGDSYLPVMDSNNLLPSTRLGILPGQHHASFAEPFEFTFFFLCVQMGWGSGCKAGESQAPEQDRQPFEAGDPALPFGSHHQRWCCGARWSRYHCHSAILPVSLWSDLPKQLGYQRSFFF